MAEWGKGDPRWLVEDRPDGINVNNWHWTEKDATTWSKSKFVELFIGMTVETDLVRCIVTELVVCEGDAVINNRKSKLMYFYEWYIKMKWKGEFKNGKYNVDGNIEIVDFTNENGIESVISIMLDTSGIESQILKDVMEHDGVEIIRNKLAIYLIMLKEYAEDVILPTPYKPITEMKHSKKLTQYKKPEVVQDAVTGDIETTDWVSVEVFKCSADQFYHAMTVKELVVAFTQTDCILEPELGGQFELFSGNIRGYFTNLEPFERIEFKWRFTKWPNDHFSDVILNINQKEDCTEVKVSQFRIPKSEFEVTVEGWKKYYWDSMRRRLGFGAFLM